MPNCIQCGHELDEGVNFCVDCGYSVVTGKTKIKCSNCNKEVKKASFCSNCGKKMTGTIKETLIIATIIGIFILIVLLGGIFIYKNDNARTILAGGNSKTTMKIIFTKRMEKYFDYKMNGNEIGSSLDLVPIESDSINKTPIHISVDKILASCKNNQCLNREFKDEFMMVDSQTAERKLTYINLSSKLSDDDTDSVIADIFNKQGPLKFNDSLVLDVYGSNKSLKLTRKINISMKITNYDHNGTKVIEFDAIDNDKQNDDDGREKTMTVYGYKDIVSKIKAYFSDVGNKPEDINFTDYYAKINEYMNGYVNRGYKNITGVLIVAGNIKFPFAYYAYGLTYSDCTRYKNYISAQFIYRIQTYEQCLQDQSSDSSKQCGSRPQKNDNFSSYYLGSWQVQNLKANFTQKPYSIQIIPVGLTDSGSIGACRDEIKTIYDKLLTS
ncbi:zinc ribbon domain-containing protein [Candidatus Microgenomates bacterium]|nr:zinc ribbon domain-containing protein [Candidatus Microgenomates bacterium]